jgi:hypothetical protein
MAQRYCQVVCYVHVHQYSSHHQTVYLALTCVDLLVGRPAGSACSWWCVWQVDWSPMVLCQAYWPQQHTAAGCMHIAHKPQAATVVSDDVPDCLSKRPLHNRCQQQLMYCAGGAPASHSSKPERPAPLYGHTLLHRRGKDTSWPQTTLLLVCSPTTAS